MHVFSRNLQLLNGIMWRSIPNFTQILPQTVTDNNIDNNKLVFTLQKSVILSERIVTPLTLT
jgi:hypothetical protein